MAGPIDTKNTRVRVSTTLAGTYTLVGYTTAYTFTEGTEGGNTILYFGGEELTAGRNTATGSLDVLFVRGDTLGQDVIRSAKRAGTTVFLQLCPEGTATGAKCEQMEVYIDEVSHNPDRSNDRVTGSINFRGIPSTLSTITLA